MIQLAERVGSGFDLIRKYKGTFRMQDALQYFGIYDNCIYTNSGKVCLGFYIDFESFRKENGFLSFIQKFDPSIESVFQIYLVRSKSTVLLYLFITVPYPYLASNSILKGLLQNLAVKEAFNKSLETDACIDAIRAGAIAAIPNSVILTDTGLHSFLNILINKNFSSIRNIRDFIYDDINVHYGHYSYHGMSNLVLKMKSFPEENVLSDLLYGSDYDFPFIMQFTITKPPKKVSNDILIAESDFAEQVRAIQSAQQSPSNNGFSLVGGDIMLTRSFGDYVYHYDCAVHFFNKDDTRLVSDATFFQQHMRDFKIIFAHEQLELINSICSYFPGLSFLYQDKFDILNTDLKYLVPWNKDSFVKLTKEKDRYPEFVPSEPSPLSEAVFKPIEIAVSSGTGEGPLLPDEEAQARASKKKDGTELSIGTRKDIIEEEAVLIKPETTVHSEANAPKSVKNIDDIVALDLVMDI